jgi:hypothetical protein
MTNRQVIVCSTRTLTDHNIATTVPKVLGLCVALASVTDNCDSFVFEQTQVSIVAVVNLGSHFELSCCNNVRLAMFEHQIERFETPRNRLLRKTQK